MNYTPPRGIIAVDVGYTSTKIALFSPDCELVAERKAASRHVGGPPYRHIDPGAVSNLCREALPELDQILPVDAIVPTAHGAALALLDQQGNLALPVMDYTSEPPPDIVADYRKVAPPFSETFCTLLPMALTHGLQLYWQERAFADGFARTRTVIPWMQYVGYLLSGTAVTEISSLSCQTHLMDTRAQRFSSLVKRQGWSRLFPPMAKAWETIGSLKPEFRGSAFRGRGAVLGGVHDSTANYMRYVAAGLDRFTLISTGTWSIGFDSAAPLSMLVEERDTNTNTDVLGRTVASSRFFGGKEFEVLSQGAPPEAASLAMAQRLIGSGVMALPSFTDSGGPVPRSGGKGRILGALPEGAEARSSLAALYCALMVSEQLDAIGSSYDIIVDGPYTENPVLLAILASLRPKQRVKASALRDGTAAGAATLALFKDGKPPSIALKLAHIADPALAGLGAYQDSWREMAYAHLA